MFVAGNRSHPIPFFLSANVLPLEMLYFETVRSLMHDILYQFCTGLRISVIFSPVHPTLTQERVIFRQQGEYLIHSTRAQHEVNESHNDEASQNNEFVFRVGEVSRSRCKTIAKNYHVFNLSNCAVAFKMQ